MKIATAKKTMDCPKCGGTGDIPRYSGIANGVCFTCAGNGKVPYRVIKKKPVPPLTESMAKFIETVKTGDLSKLSFGKLNELRNGCHWPTPHCPELLSIWRERGDPYFFAAQERHLSDIGY